MNSTKLCECGCGQPTSIAKRTNRRDGHIKGQPVRFISGHSSRGHRPPRQPLQGLPPEERFWHHVKQVGACLEWTGSRNERGYGVFRTYSGPKDKNGKSQYAHRYAWARKHGPIPEGLDICHRCDNPPCVLAVCDVPGCEHLLESQECESHLFLGTDADNNRDMIRKGRRGDNRKWWSEHPEAHRGEKNPNASLTKEMVWAIRDDYYVQVRSQKATARRLGVSGGAVQCVVEGKTWGWLPNEDGTPFVPRPRSNQPRGRDIRLAKLTEEQVKEIRMRYAADGIGASALGRHYGVTKRCVLSVVHRETWKHVSD